MSIHADEWWELYVANTRGNDVVMYVPPASQNSTRYGNIDGQNDGILKQGLAHYPTSFYVA